jgi:hypothetical protein
MTEEDTDKYFGAVSIADAQPVETYQMRINKQMRREMEEADQERIRQQKLVDHLWQAKLDAEAPLDDDWDYSTGFQERRHKVTCHRGRWDPDF